MPPSKPSIEIRRADKRFRTEVDWLDSKHSFSFGPHQDRNNTHHGLLLVNNDDRVQAGTGFDTHPHRDMEIVTWVLQGSLVHQDSTGHTGVIYPGLAQRMSAGRGIYHSERNDSWRIDGDVHNDPVHFIQMWVVPDENGIDPGYEQLEIDPQRLASGLIPVASGSPVHAAETAIRIKNQHATLHAARLRLGQTVNVPEAPYVHVFIAQGSVELEDNGTLNAGDAVRLTSTGGHTITATESSEILVWEMHATLS
jgi:quercetin 2,3-dioxygenase